MYERFTDRAKKVMQLANQEARRFNHEYIRTEHILLGLIREGSGVAANVLKNLDVDPRRIRLEVEKLVQSGPDVFTMGKLPQTPRAKKVIEYSMEEARNLNHNYVGTEHILLALVREDMGVAAQILMNVGLDLGRVREEVRRLHGGDDAGAPAMYGRFTDHARNAMQWANQQAERLHHEYIGTGHILLGLMESGDCGAAAVLENLRVDRRRIHADTTSVLRQGSESWESGKLPLTPRAKTIIEYSMDEARKLKHERVGTEHILLGLLRENGGVAAQILINVGLDLGKVREEVRRLHGGATSSEAPAVGAAAQRVDEGNLPAVCPKCGHGSVVHVLRDFIHLFGNDERDVEAGRAILGGRSGAILPAWVCLDCQPRWSEVHRMALQDLQWDDAKAAAVAATNFEEAARIRDAQTGWRQQLRVLVEALLAEKTP